VTLDMHCSGRRVYPSGSYKEQHGEHPERRQTDGKPAND
jgi:hypothetical protein